MSAPLRISLLLPYPPSSNVYWQTSRGVTHRSAIAKEYCAVVADLAAHRVLGVTTQPVTLTGNVFRPRQSGDLTNTIKILEDALKGVVLQDDKQTAEIHWTRWEDPQLPRVQLVVEERLDVARIPPAPIWLTEEENRLWKLSLARLERVRVREREATKRRKAKRTEESDDLVLGESVEQRLARLARPATYRGSR